MSFLKRLFRLGGRDYAADPPPPLPPGVRAADLLSPLARPCWIPEVADAEDAEGAQLTDTIEAADFQTADLSSRFGGRAALGFNESLPACGACGKAMPLWLQLDLESIPARAREMLAPSLREGILQFFYCTDDDCDNVDTDAFAHNMLARIKPASSLAVLAPPSESDHEVRPISGWSERRDLPDSEEACTLLGDQAPDDDDLQAFYDHGFANNLEHPKTGDKLLGWPEWVQGMYYPPCPHCGKPLSYLFQIASEDHIPYMFGDCGVGHLCFCPDHPERGAFYWACC